MDEKRNQAEATSLIYRECSCVEALGTVVPTLPTVYLYSAADENNTQNNLNLKVCSSHLESAGRGALIGCKDVAYRGAAILNLTCIARRLQISFNQIQSGRVAGERVSSGPAHRDVSPRQLRLSPESRVPVITGKLIGRDV